MKVFEKWISMANPPMRSSQQTSFGCRKVARPSNRHVFYNKRGRPIAPFPRQPDEYRQGKRTLAIAFYEARDLYHELIAEPVHVTIAVVMPYRKLDIKAKQTGLLPKITTPDIDNGTIKMYLDAMQPYEEIKDEKVVLSLPGLYKNDKYVSNVSTAKWFGPDPGIYIKIEPVDARAAWEMIAPVAGWKPTTLFTGETEA